MSWWCRVGYYRWWPIPVILAILALLGGCGPRPPSPAVVALPIIHDTPRMAVLDNVDTMTSGLEEEGSLETRRLESLHLGEADRAFLRQRWWALMLGGPREPKEAN